MTIFLCAFALLALILTPNIKGSSRVVFAALVTHYALVLGLATLAVYTWSVSQ